MVDMKDLNKAAAALGRKGGLKRVPKGFSKLSAEQKSAMAETALLKRWGKFVSFSNLTVACLPRDVEAIMEAASYKQENGETRRPIDLPNAVLSIILDNLKTHGIRLVVANGSTENDVPITEYTEHYFPKETSEV